jgi:hypothetical protein
MKDGRGASVVYLPLGSWSGAMVGLGAILYTLRLRYHSLSRGWLTHALFNAPLFLIYPLSGGFHRRYIPAICEGKS